MALVLSADARDGGGVTATLFHCIFNADGSITHFMHDVDLGLYHSLANMYAVCIAEKSAIQRKVTGGFFVRTSYTHDDKDFDQTLSNAVSTIPPLAKLITKHSSFLPARIPNLEGPPLTEKEMLKVMITQALKHSSMGVA